MIPSLPSGSWLHITVGFVFGIAITVFTFVTAKLLKQNNATRKIIGALVLFSVSIGLISVIYDFALSGGLLLEWQLLDFPAISDPATKIIDVGYVQAQSGNIYHYTCIACNEGKWEQVKSVPSDKKDYIVPAPDGCGGTLSFLPLLNAKFTASKTACVFIGPGYVKAVYAIDDVGQVYSWVHGVGEFSGIEKLLFLVNGGITSCIFGTIVVLLLVLVAFLKTKKQELGQKTNPME